MWSRQHRTQFWDSGFTCGSNLDLSPAPRKAHVQRREIKWYTHPPNPSLLLHHHGSLGAGSLGHITLLMQPDISTILNFRHPSPFLETGLRRDLGIYREPPWEGLATESSEREGRTMASAATEAEKGSPVVVGLLVVGNIIILLSGLALFAETVWVTADQYRVYPLMGVSGKDDVFAGAWIAIFCGFSLFVVASFGVGAALCRRRSMILTYLVLMLIVYIFECASCITSYTHRDYMVSNPSLIAKQMLTFYSADTDQGQELTRLWDRVMIEQECCGTSGPMDWVNFTSAFRAATPEVVFPWPPLCCRRTGNFIPLSAEGCRLGHTDYLFTKGCFEHIGHAIDSYTWGISWFGFAILMWTVRGGKPMGEGGMWVWGWSAPHLTASSSSSL
uniref:uroplakin-1a isoform X3 n=1 Tax=Halichoerus grypus TaxID=9711 RepID=UPI001659A598|nr:uroplakin-1a isoform X3 [Halichoerus grypus]